ncbi:MAG: hypothetical protein RIQ57_973 [Pseudomonadota bacterium]|jgi:hypothetical protein
MSTKDKKFLKWLLLNIKHSNPEWKDEIDAFIKRMSPKK